MELRKGGHRDLERYYQLMEIDFDSEELIPKLLLHRALSSGAVELLIASDEQSGLETGYALAFTKGLYNYVLLKYMGVMPWYRGKGLGIELMRKLNKRYAQKQGIVAEIAEFEDEDENRVKKLQRFFERFGYIENRVDYRIAGTKTHLYVKPVLGTAEIEPVLKRIMADFYNGVMPFSMAQRMITIEEAKSSGDK